ncbi:MAG: hypothetical protein K9J16_18685 [Melioribacteraceae bacterium]|nr:hypothetical protein [Melioribacteraceae bacterium]MCF8418961.1 hypothetical protein [Melioribacteraceae bacterium]
MANLRIDGLMDSCPITNIGMSHPITNIGMFHKTLQILDDQLSFHYVALAAPLRERGFENRICELRINELRICGFWIGG